MRNPRKEVGRNFSQLIDYSQIINTPGGAGAGTVTSVAMTVPTGLTVTGSPITTAGTLAVSLTAGYLIPTTASKTDWDSAFNDKIVSAAVTGTTTKTLTLTQQDAGTITASWSDISGTGTVTSVDMTVPTGLSISGNPITTSGTLALTLTAGYSIPTTSSQTNWDTAYTNRITSLTVTGSSGASTLISNVLNIPTYTLTGLGGQPLATNLTSLAALTFASTSFVKMTSAGTFALDTTVYTSNTGTVTSVAALTLGTTGTDLSSSVANGTTTPVITLNVPTASATNRGALSSTDWSTFNGKESALTFSSPLSRATNTISIPAATTSVNGYLTSTDWTTFNGKFTLPALTSGSVLFSNGTTISQDNANFFWDNTNNRLGIGTATPANNLDVVRGTAGTMARGFYESSSVSYNADTKFGIYTASATATDGAALYLGQTNLLNASSQYGGFELQYRYNSSTTENLRINYVSRLATGAVSTATMDLFTLSKTGVATFASSLTATSFVKSGGTSAQILAADGSVITAGTNITISGGTISASGGSGTDFYTTNGTLTSARTITGGGFDLTYSDNKNSTAQFVISNTTAGTTSTAAVKLTSDATAGYGFIGKVSSSWTTNAIITNSDLAIINYTAGDLVLLNTFATGLITFGVGTGTTPLMTLTNDSHLLIGTTTNSTYHLDVNGDANANKINLAAGTLTRAPLDFTPGSAVLKTTPIAGDTEVSSDGKLYYTHNTSERGVVDAFQFFTPNANISLTAQTAAQKIFNTLTNGAITLKAATNYRFEMMLQITGMASSGTFGFENGGAATFSNILWWSNGIKGASTTAATFQSTYNTSFTNAALVTATAVTSGYVHIVGKFRVLAAGTFIPQITFSAIPTTPVIVAGSYFKITAISDNLTDRIGNWS